MSVDPSDERLQIPETLRRQLDDFRRRVWTIKTVEAGCSAAFGVLAAYLVMFAIDRAWDTPGWARAALLGLAALACATVPLAVHRWVWRHRRPDQLARLLARKLPRIGDQLLGVIELARDDSEQARSRRLVEAAIEQVAVDAEKRDFRDATPDSRHRAWAGMLIVPVLATFGLLAACPAAASNAWARLLAPWRDTPRYTFAALESPPRRMVVAHGEPFQFAVKLDDGTAWRPAVAEARIGGRAPVVARLKDGRYEFVMPGLVVDARLELRVGDASRSVEVAPMLRPELTAIEANVALPAYLGRPGTQKQDVRGGAITLVKGSRARFAARAGRDLAVAWVDGVAQRPNGATATSPEVAVDADRDVRFRWEDHHGLAGKEPFTLKLNGRDDEAPTLSVEDLPRQKVVLDSELLNFKVRAQDDFGVRRVGLEWRGIDPKGVRSPAVGERALALGGVDQETLHVVGAFSARSFGIEPQPIALRVFVEDGLPGRARVFSAPYTLFVLGPEQHAIWLAEQLSKWHRQSLEVRDREVQLYEANKQLRALAPEELDRPEVRAKIEAQAQAERANGRRLSGLVVNGEDLVKQAMRNPEFGVGHLERWAEMLQVLKDISGNRMPSVADLLKQAAQAEKVASGSPPTGNKAPMAGNIRSAGGAKPTEPAPAAPKPPSAVPTVVDRESSQQPPDEKEAAPAPGSSPKTPRLLLPKTELAGGVKPGPPANPPAAQKVDEALIEQRDLLAEFEKVADELNRVLANLEGSTLVKRLKAASRVQSAVAAKIGDQLGDTFGVATPPIPAVDPDFGGMRFQAVAQPPLQVVVRAKNARPKPSAMLTVAQPPLQVVVRAAPRPAPIPVVPPIFVEAAPAPAPARVVVQVAPPRDPIAVAPPMIVRELTQSASVPTPRFEAPVSPALAELAEQEAKGSHVVSVIMDDMAFYFERRRNARFKTVLDEMRQQDAIGSLRQLGDDLKSAQGLSIAQCEYWSDTFDRWADDLVDPANSGTCPGSKSRGSLPPSVVLEVLQILEAEVNLREETRVAEQARAALAAEEFGKQADGLAKTQDVLKDRVAKVTDRIKELPDAEAEFGREIDLLGEVAAVMEDATGILARPETGPPALAAETEAIELLLQSKRINPKGGGGGGASPGGGGRGTTTDSALVLVGNGVNPKEVREDRGTAQATGETGPALPEEYRSGLDRYFNQLERPDGR